jgi:hypothetical protein
MNLRFVLGSVEAGHGVVRHPHLRRLCQQDGRGPQPSPGKAGHNRRRSDNLIMFLPIDFVNSPVETDLRIGVFSANRSYDFLARKSNHRQRNFETLSNDLS